MTYRLLVITAIAVAGVAGAAWFRKEFAMRKWSFARPEIPVGHQTEEIAVQGGAILVFGSLMPDVEGIPGVSVPPSEAFALRLAAGAAEWRKTYSGPGELFRASVAGADVIYALGSTALGDPKSVFLMKSEDNGQKWHSVPPPPAGSIGCHFAARGRGRAWTRDAVFTTEDDGTSWAELVRFDEEIFSRVGLDPAFDAAGALWAAAGSRVYRIVAQERREIALPKGAVAFSIAPAPDLSAWVAVRQQLNKVAVYRIDARLQPRLLAELPISFAPERLHVGPKVATLLGVDVGQGSQAPRYMAFSSSDGGQTWERETLATASLLRAAFFEDDHVWAYAGMGRIQLR